MHSQNITRVMIDFAVSRGIKEIAEDPKRGIRKLADMGSQFTPGHFHEEIMRMVQATLKNDDSPYYMLMENLLLHTDHGIIQKFGVNVGYNSWTVGARTLQEKSAALGVPIPWILLFHYHPQDAEGMTAARISQIVAQAKTLGIYTFCILQDEGFSSSRDLIRVFDAHDDCVFFLFLHEAQITAAQIKGLKSCGNTLISVNAAAPDALDTCMTMRESGLLYAAHQTYTSETLASVTDADAVLKLLRLGSSMLFFLQTDHGRRHAGTFVRTARLEQTYPCFLWDLYSDIAYIGKKLFNNTAVLELHTDGSVCRPFGKKKYHLLRGNETLESLLLKLQS